MVKSRKQASPGECVSGRVKLADATTKIIRWCCGRQTRRRSDFRGLNADCVSHRRKYATYILLFLSIGIFTVIISYVKCFYGEYLYGKQCYDKYCL